MNVLVTGGAGFIGSHLCESLVAAGHQVACLDDLSSGRRDNLQELAGNSNFTFERADICRALEPERTPELIFHLASPASPKDYLVRPLDTLRTCAEGTARVLELAERSGARLVHASTSEVYGDPLESPQREEYWGNVNPIGPRSAYDEGKRYAESLIVNYAAQKGVDARIARIFNTYGPRLRPGDGRVVPNFICQAIAGKPLTVYGDGAQTRSFQYVSDLIAGLVALAEASQPPPGPVNLGNPVETTVLELARLVLELTGSDAVIAHQPLPADDPRRRCPSVERARQYLRWEPRVPLREGLSKTIAYFKQCPA